MSSAFFRCNEHTVSCQHIRGYYRATAFSQETELRLAVKQYTPLNNLDPRAGDITIIAAHATGSCKELYEPFFEELCLAANRSNGRIRIRSIWIADIATHGSSSMLNEGKVGIDCEQPRHLFDDGNADLLRARSMLGRPCSRFNAPNQCLPHGDAQTLGGYRQQHGWDEYNTARASTPQAVQYHHLHRAYHQ